MLLPDLQRLTRIQDYCIEISETILRYGNSYEIFCGDKDFQKSIVFSVLQIGELVGALSNEYRAATRHRIPWGLIKAMRNIIVHNYGNIDWEAVWDTAITSVPELKAFCDEQLDGDKQGVPQ